MASHIIAWHIFLPKLPSSPASLGLFLQVHSSQLRPLPHLPFLLAALSLAPISPSDCKPFRTHRWEAAFQPHAVLALIQMLNREEEQFHTPYLAWERRSETAWMLPGKAAWAWAWAWAWRCWHTYPESRRRAWNLCHLTPKANHPAYERTRPFLHQPTQGVLSEYVGVAEGRGGIRATWNSRCGSVDHLEQRSAVRSRG